MPPCFLHSLKYFYVHMIWACMLMLSGNLCTWHNFLGGLVWALVLQGFTARYFLSTWCAILMCFSMSKRGLTHKGSKFWASISGPVTSTDTWLVWCTQVLHLWRSRPSDVYTRAQAVKQREEVLCVSIQLSTYCTNYVCTTFWASSSNLRQRTSNFLYCHARNMTENTDVSMTRTIHVLTGDFLCSIL